MVGNITTSVPPYLKILDSYEHSLLAKLRLGTLPLAIETGRYTNTSVEHRLCKYCTLNVVEDEKHFILECT